jgi:regulator of sigma E protease
VITVSAETPIAFAVERDGQIISITATPRRAPSDTAQGPRAGQGILGISGPAALQSERQVEPIGPLEAISVGANNTWAIIAQTGAYIGGVFAGRESGDQIAGPLGIINVSGQVATGALSGPGDDWPTKLRILGLSLLGLAAVLSVAVGFVNLLPIPILDGGHLLFYGIEALRGGKPLPAAAQEWAYRAGFAVMASLFLFATWNDITRLLPGAQ